MAPHTATPMHLLHLTFNTVQLLCVLVYPFLLLVELLLVSFNLSPFRFSGCFLAFLFLLLIKPLRVFFYLVSLLIQHL